MSICAFTTKLPFRILKAERLQLMEDGECCFTALSGGTSFTLQSR